MHLLIPPLSRYSREYPLLQHRPLTKQYRNMRHPILHDNRPRTSSALHVARLPHDLPTHGIPSLCLLQRKVAIQLEIKGVELADLGMGRLLCNLTGHVQLCGLRVEVGGLDADEEGDVDAVGRGAAGGGLGGYASDGGGAEEILRAY